MSLKKIASQALPELRTLMKKIQAESQCERAYHERNMEGKLKRYTDLPPLDKQLKEYKVRFNNLSSDKANLCSWSVAWLVAALTCDKQRQLEILDRDIGIIMAHMNDIQKQMDHVEHSVNRIRQSNDDDYLEIRSLEQHRDLVEELLRPIFAVHQDQDLAAWELRIQVAKAQRSELLKTNEILLQVIDLLQETRDYLTEGIFYARDHTGKPEETIKQFFPDEAIVLFKKARELYPQLPKFKRPDGSSNTTPKVGSIYSTAASRYLTEVRQHVEEMEEQCRQTIVENAKSSCEMEIQIGTDIDRFNVERFYIISQLA